MNEQRTRPGVRPAAPKWWGVSLCLLFGATCVCLTSCLKLDLGQQKDYIGPLRPAAPTPPPPPPPAPAPLAPSLPAVTITSGTTSAVVAPSSPSIPRLTPPTSETVPLMAPFLTPETTPLITLLPPPPPGPLTVPTTVPLPIATSGTLAYDVDGAILESLSNNQALKVEKLNPQLRRLAEQTERAAFDPTLTGSASYERSRTERKSATGAMVETTSKRTAGALGISEFLPTGTNMSVDLSAQRTWATGAGDANTAAGQLAITQALLRGASIDANLASLRSARLDTVSSEYELRGTVLQQVASVEETYWDYALAQKQIKIYYDSVILAEQQLNETRYRVEYGKLARTELAASEAEVAIRREALINANSTLATTRLRLLRLINPSDSKMWDRDILLRNEPVATRMALEDVATHISVAMKMRPELNQARLSAQKGELQVVKTRNGLLPRLDMFISLGRTGYADSFEGSVKADDGKTIDGQIGFNFEYPLGNRGPQASYLRSKISLAQTEEALANTAQLVELDVRSAYIEVIRAHEQVPATEATRRLQAETLRAETEKFRIGKSTSFLVARAQRDYLSAQIDEIRAVVGHLKAMVEIYRLDGSLLERRGISAPGRKPVSDVAWKTR